MNVRIPNESDRGEWLRMRLELWPECPRERHALEIRMLADTGFGRSVFVAPVTFPARIVYGWAMISVREARRISARGSAVPVPWPVDGSFARSSCGPFFPVNGCRFNQRR